MRFLIFIILISTAIYGELYKIMPLGDSITFGDSYNPPPDNLKHAYRNYLWYSLNDNNYEVDFVGTRRSGWSVTPPFDPDNEGYPGWSSFDISHIVYNKLVATRPDIILLHIGSNDIWIPNNKDNPRIDGVNNILNEIDRYERNSHHHIKVILATIIDRTYHPPFTNLFNNKLRALANQRIRNGDDIILVDMQHGAHLIYNSTDFQDPTHPNDNGYRKMARVWYDALSRVLVPYPLPQTPTNFQAINIDSKEVTLKWNDVNNEEGYIVYKDSQVVAILPSNTTQTTIKNLTPNTKYTFKIVAYNKRGYSNEAYISIVTKHDLGWLPAVYNILQ